MRVYALSELSYRPRPCTQGVYAPNAISAATDGLFPGLWAWARQPRAKKKSSKRGHEGIEPSTSPTLKENHTTRPMAHAPRSTESLLQLPATPALWFPRDSSTAFRAPLAERSAVNRQVLGSIPSGGVLFIFTPRRFLRRLLCAGDRESPQTPWRNGSASDSKSEGWGFDSLWRHRDLVLF